MTTSFTSARFTVEQVPLAQTALHVLIGGGGRPCLVLHGIEGHEGWLAFHESLAEHATVYAPSHPGYGHTPCPEWITSVRHQAIFYHWFLQEAALTDVDLIGIGMGGWLAAEMAVMDSSRLRNLVLVDAAGLRPARSEIFDVFVASWRDVIERGFSNARQAPEYQRIYADAPIQDFGGAREAGRVMSMRMCFKPYMYDPSLAGMLGKIRVPTLVVWGQDDAIVPFECAEQYQRQIPGSILRTLPACGHFAHLDQPQALAAAVRDFCSTR